MSKLIDMMYQTNAKRKMSRTLRVIYLLLGVGAAAFLLTAYFSDNQPLHQIGTTVCLVAMSVINAVSDIRSIGLRTYMAGNFRRDFGILMIWVLLLIIWIVDPQPE